MSLSTLALGFFYVLLGTSRILLLRFSTNAGKAYIKLLVIFMAQVYGTMAG